MSEKFGDLLRHGDERRVRARAASLQGCQPARKRKPSPNGQRKKQTGPGAKGEKTKRKKAKRVALRSREQELQQSAGYEARRKPAEGWMHVGEMREARCVADGGGRGYVAPRRKESLACKHERGYLLPDEKKAPKHRRARIRVVIYSACCARGKKGPRRQRDSPIITQAFPRGARSGAGGFIRGADGHRRRRDGAVAHSAPLPRRPFAEDESRTWKFMGRGP
ncbi:hypothetical protein HPB50_017179 [Hyalomma asiaticum]|uniref:Uncharacterized protein n=1 Tax=Hyalomma asiaticum TaxID=266040 RepID=A0ACB7TLC4_HYAAI|nr:hypothetical protein HPB50_017179 [Hyalomma asiaticum]